MTVLVFSFYSSGVDLFRSSKIIVITVLAVLTSHVFAHVPEDGDIHALFSPFVVRTLPLKHQFPSPYMGGIGIRAEGDLDKNGGVEISALFMRQLFSIKRGDQIVTESNQRVYVATGYRYWFTPRISCGLAFYSSFSMGDAETVQNDFGVNNSPETSAQESVTYGFDTSVQFEALQKARYSVVMEARYAYPVTAKPQEDSNMYMVMVGLKYFLQSREEEVNSQKAKSY